MEEEVSTETFSFLFSVGNQLVINKMKNNLKIYLQKFADIKYLRRFVVLLAMKLQFKTKQNEKFILHPKHKN